MTNPLVLVVRKDDSFSAALRNAEFNVINLELIETRPIADQGEMETMSGRLGEFDAIIFTSPSAVEVFLERFPGKPSELKPVIYALGDRAITLLEYSGFAVESRLAANTAADLITDVGIDRFAGKKILFFRGTRTNGTIPELLGTVSQLDESIVYETVECELDRNHIATLRDQFESGEIHWICFFSPSGVERFRDIFETVRFAKVAVIGETTAAAARANGLTISLIADRANNADFAEQLIKQQEAIG
ncbi:MAG: uroporphyrinogen-III synthase [Pyrinomonadaceae bacterium]